MQHIKSVTSFFLAGVALATAFTVYAQPTRIDTLETGVAGTEPIQVLDTPFEQRVDLAAGLGRVVFIRPIGGDQITGSITLFVNDRYHTSLVEGGYADLCIPQRPLSLGVRTAKVGQPAQAGFDSMVSVNVQAGTTQYLTVLDRRGVPFFTRIDEAQAQKHLTDLRRQVHTISRVPDAQNCNTMPATMAEPGTPQELGRPVILATDVFFQIGRSDTAGLALNGLLGIDQLINRVRNEYARVDHIRIVGHADPLGSAGPNQQLSQARAALVRDYIQRRAPFAANTPITVEGLGSQSTVVDCGGRRGADAVACNQLNRRVEVEIAGYRFP